MTTTPVVVLPARPRLRSVVVVAVAAVALVAGSGQLVRSPAGTTTLPLPPAGQVTGVWMDGEPVWVVNGRRETTVLSAISPAPLFGLKHLVSWCVSSGLLTTYWDGSAFDLGGRYVSGPAPRDLDRFEALARGDGTVQVGQRFTPTRRSIGAADSGGRNCITSGADSGPLGRYHVARQAGFEVMSGYVVFRDAGPALFCEALVGEAIPRCPPDSRVVAEADAGLDSDDWLVIAGRFMTRVGDRELTDVIVLPVGRIQRDPDH